MVGMLFPLAETLLPGLTPEELGGLFIPEIVAIVACLMSLAAEAMHIGRVRQLAALAFGPGRRPAFWARFAPALRVLAMTALSWGLATLFVLEPTTHNAGEIDVKKKRHLVLLLDVSPSMRLDDAGPESDQSRTQRARVLIESLFDRVPIRQYRLSVIAFYNDAIPVVVDTEDLEVVKNTLNDLPMHFAFEGDKTDLFKGLEKAVEVTKSWQPSSTVLLVVSDGDTVPPTGMPKLPVSISNTLVIGIGDPVKGSFIDGRNSRQDVSMLRQTAARLGGEFHNGNEKHISTAVINELSQNTMAGPFSRLGRREYALIAIAIGSSLLIALPMLLTWFGTSWQVGTIVGRP